MFPPEQMAPCSLRYVNKLFGGSNQWRSDWKVSISVVLLKPIEQDFVQRNPTSVPSDAQNRRSELWDPFADGLSRMVDSFGTVGSILWRLDFEDNRLSMM